MSSVSEKTVIRSRAAPATLKISDWPLRDEPLLSLFVILIILAVSVAAAIAVRHYGVGLLIFALLSITVRRLWLPSTYELGSKGLVHYWLGRRRRIPWTEFSRYEVHNRGILICGDVEPNPFSVWHGFFIRCNDRRDEVLAVVEFYLQGPLQTALLSTRTLSHVSPPPAPNS